jgi:uncharacterized protein (DUF433 family)
LGIIEIMESRIAIDPNVCHGKPVVANTRVMVSVVLSAIAGGDSIEQVADDYRISVEDVLACIAFAAHEVDSVTYRAVAS